MPVQDGTCGSQTAFYCASAEAVTAATAGQPPSHAAHALTAQGRHARAVPGLSPAGKRAAPASHKHAVHVAKKSRIASEAGDSFHGFEADTSNAVKARLPAVHVIQVQLQSRRVVPQQVASAAASPQPGHVSSSTKPAHRIIPEMLTTAPGRNTSSCGKKSFSGRACDLHRTSALRMCDSEALSNLSNRLSHEEDTAYSDTADSSHCASEDLSQEALEVGSEGEAEEAQPGKLLVEFGAAGDAWWNDFIAAKEEMLTDVLQVRLSPLATFLSVCRCCKACATLKSYLAHLMRSTCYNAAVRHPIA